MKNIRFKTILSVVSLLFLTTACSSLLDEETFTFVSDGSVVESNSYDKLVTGAYNALNYSFEWGNYHSVVNFDCDYQTGPTWAFGTMGAGNFLGSGDSDSFYKNYCIVVHRANYHSFLINKMSISDDVKNNAMGELAFLKAFALFEMVRFWGPIPLYTHSVSEGEDYSLPRSSIEDVYKHIIDCLKYAEVAMYSTQDSEYKKGHASRGAAKALLAKVYCTIASAAMPSGNVINVMGGPGAIIDDASGSKIKVPVPAKLEITKDQVKGYEVFDYKEYYRLAMEKAREVINSGDFDLEESQEKLWDVASKNGKEFIFTLQTYVDGSTEYSNYVTSDYGGYYKEDGSLSAGYYVQRDHWYQLFDESDDRVKWGVVHRKPFNYNETLGRLEWCYYPAKDSVKVRLGLDGYEPTDVLKYDAHLYGSTLKKFYQVSTPLDGNRNDYNWPFLRYAEVLLLYAEADNEVNNGPSAEALSVMEKLNNRNHSKTVYELGLQKPWDLVTFRSYVLEERAKELAAEGHRRNDLIRWGIYLQVMNGIGTTDENDVIKRRENKHLLLPFPADVINANEFIEINNPGW